MARLPPTFAAPFRALFELSPDAILLFIGGTVAHANPAAALLLGANEPSDLVGRNSRDLIDPESLPIVERNVAEIMTGNATSTRSEEKYVRLDGAVIDVEVTAARAVFLDGKAFIVILRDIGHRREAELRARRERESEVLAEAAEERERWLLEILDVLPILVFARDGRGAFVLANQRCADFYGRPARALLGHTPVESGHPDASLFAAEDAGVLANGEPLLLPERELVDAAGCRRVFEGVKVRVRLGDGYAVLGAFTDLTERKQLEAQLVHAQKMEAVGRLAGGIAHDFNNLLTVILESAEHLAGAIEDPEGDLARIRRAAARAASLTRQMLAFARKTHAEPRTVPLDAHVAQTAGLLSRVLGEDIELVTDLGAGDAHISVDPEKLDLVLMNLAVNARDAMPGEGRLALSTRLVDASLRPDGPPSGCVLLEVRDTGCGMDDATRSRAFEPFYTTKAPGRGTGLGLSSSYGIIVQFGGRIELSSAVGAGTSVRIYLPLAAVGDVSEARRAESAPPPRGDETVLLLEDDAAVRRSTHRMLRALGYTVLVAGLPSEALAMARDHPGHIDVLVTDVVMPQMNGVQVAREFAEVRPGTRVLFVSGYDNDALAGAPARLQLAKPFSMRELGQKLREVLDSLG